jgi:hypothetical protein
MANNIEKVDRRSNTVKHKKNPFLAEAVAEVDLGRKTVSFGTGNGMVDTETGEYQGESAFKMSRVVDKSQFLMMYMGMQSAFWQLTARSQKVLRIIFYQAQHNAIGKDEIHLSWEAAEEIFVQEGIKISRATYFRGVAELVEKRVIAESTRPSIFFLNPTLLFNGNRATFIQQIITDDPDVVKEAQEITAKRALEAHRELSPSKLKEIGDQVKIKKK